MSKLDRYWSGGMAPSVRYAVVDDYGNCTFNETKAGALRRASRMVGEGRLEASVYLRGPPHEIVAQYRRGEDGKAHKVAIREPLVLPTRF